MISDKLPRTTDAPQDAARHSRLWPVFLTLGAAFFGFALLDRATLVAATFSSLLLILFLAWLLSFIMSPVVDAMHRPLARYSRGLIASGVYGLLLAALIGIVWLVAQVGAPEAADLLGRGDEISARIIDLLTGLQATLGISHDVVDLAGSFASAEAALFPDLATSLNAQLQTIASTTITVLGNLFIVVVLSLYVVIDSDSIEHTLERMVPGGRAEEFDLFRRTVGRAFRGFLKVTVITVLIQVLLTLVVGVAFGLPYLFLTTAIVAIVMLIPFFGPGLALLPPIGVAIAFRPDVAILVTLVLFIAQTLMLNLLMPKLMQRNVGLHPILVLVALLLGAQVAGIWGAVFGIPVAAVITILARYALDKRAVMAAEGIELDEVVAEIREEIPDMPIEEVVAQGAEMVEELEGSEPTAPGVTPPAAARARRFRLPWQKRS